MVVDEQQVDVNFSYAPGKIILVGEHAVVYGATAIAMPIDCGVRVALMPLPLSQKNPGPMVRGLGPFFMGDTYSDAQSAGPQVLKSALAYIREVFGPAMEKIAIIVDGSLPPGSGLGSSASLSVALVKGIFRFLRTAPKSEELEKHIMALETIFHGQPSGIDHSVILSGDVIAYTKVEQRVQMRALVVKTPLSFVIGIAGPHDGTKNAVLELSHRKRRQEKMYGQLFHTLNAIAHEMEKALLDGDKASVGELMNIAQGLLNALSLSTPQIENLCAIARVRGALGAKLTGAGGGGAVIALADGNERDLMNAFKAAGYQSFVAKVPLKGGLNAATYEHVGDGTTGLIERSSGAH